MIIGMDNEVTSVINLSGASGRVAASLFIHPTTIDALVTGMGMEPKFHTDWSKNRRARGLCTYCVYNTILLL